MNWRTTIALQKISSTKNISAKRLPRKKRTAVLLREAHEFGNRIENRCLPTHGEFKKPGVDGRMCSKAEWQRRFVLAKR